MKKPSMLYSTFTNEKIICSDYEESHILVQDESSSVNSELSSHSSGQGF